MIRLLFFVTFIFNLSNASIILNGVTFDDYEQNASTYFVQYYPYQDFINIGLSSASSSYVLACRDNGTPSLSCASNTLSSSDLLRIRENSHLIDWNVYTDEFGMTLHQTNFLYGLTGLLVGFGFYIGFISLIVRK